jgi:hypothetical protein
MHISLMTSLGIPLSLPELKHAIALTKPRTTPVVMAASDSPACSVALSVLRKEREGERERRER